MAAARLWRILRRVGEDESLRPDLARATRATLAFMVPLVLASTVGLPVEASFAAIAAQNIAMVDVRGAYALRASLLLAMVLVLAASAALGAFVAQHLPGAIVVTGFVALVCGVWRHLSAEYGGPLAIASMLVFFLALAAPEGASVAAHHALAVIGGGALGFFLQVAFWPVRPQHPLRRTVAESWLAAADLFSQLQPPATASAAETPHRHENVVTAEAALRAAIDKAAIVLIQSGSKHRGPLVERLEALNLAAARLAVRVVGLHTAMEACLSEAAFARVAPAFQPVLTSLANTSRAVALTAVSGQPGHLAACEVRLRRASSLLRVLRSRLQAPGVATAHAARLEAILRQIEAQLPAIGQALHATVARAGERAAFSMELFELNTWTLRPLAAALNFRPRPDAALVRYTLRLAVLTMGGVLLYKLLRFPHGYWLPFTMVVVLQPDYGATRQRAAQRVAGTVAGSIAATLLLWLHLPEPAVLILIGVSVFIFCYIVKRHYGIAVFFVTVFVVLMMESAGPGGPGVAAERIISTLAGGLLALGAAAAFWPLWERERFPGIMGHALGANRDYLGRLADYLTRGARRDEPLIAAKRAAESANGEAFGSLGRMFGDPRNRREGIEQAAALANGNQRLTRLLNLLLLHVDGRAAIAAPELAQFTRAAERALASLRTLVEGGSLPPGEPAACRAQLDSLAPVVSPSVQPESAAADWLFVHLSRAATELSAMLLAVEPSAAEPA